MDELQYKTAWDGIVKTYRADRLAHAYLIVGSARGNGLSLAKDFLKLLFCKKAELFCGECPACRHVEAQEHVDSYWIEPHGKSRQIKADPVRGLIRRMEQSSYEGGWKAGVILSADRMNPNSQNAVL
jgi:DNA polymerase-3 subunit delta'